MTLFFMRQLTFSYKCYSVLEVYLFTTVLVSPSRSSSLGSYSGRNLAHAKSPEQNQLARLLFNSREMRRMPDNI